MGHIYCTSASVCVQCVALLPLKILNKMCSNASSSTPFVFPSVFRHWFVSVLQWFFFSSTWIFSFELWLRFCMTKKRQQRQQSGCVAFRSCCVEFARMETDKCQWIIGYLLLFNFWNSPYTQRRVKSGISEWDSIWRIDEWIIGRTDAKLINW